MFLTNKIIIAQANEAHAEYIGDHLRQSDREELLASSIASPRQTVISSFHASDKAYCGLVSGRPVLIFGTVTKNKIFSVGSPWMLATDEIEDHAIQFLKGCEKYIEEMRSDYKFLENYVDIRNKTSIRWLRWLGFHMEEPKPYAHKNMPFMRFTMTGHSYPSGDA